MASTREPSEVMRAAAEAARSREGETAQDRFSREVIDGQLRQIAARQREADEAERRGDGDQAAALRAVASAYAGDLEAKPEVRRELGKIDREAGRAPGPEQPKHGDKYNQVDHDWARATLAEMRAQEAHGRDERDQDGGRNDAMRVSANTLAEAIRAADAAESRGNYEETVRLRGHAADLAGAARERFQISNEVRERALGGREKAPPERGVVAKAVDAARELAARTVVVVRERANQLREAGAEKGRRQADELDRRVAPIAAHLREQRPERADQLARELRSSTPGLEERVQSHPPVDPASIDRKEGGHVSDREHDAERNGRDRGGHA